MVLSLLKEIAILFTYVTVQYNIVMYELKSDKEWYSVTDIRKSQKIQKKNRRRNLNISINNSKKFKKIEELIRFYQLCIIFIYFNYIIIIIFLIVIQDFFNHKIFRIIFRFFNFIYFIICSTNNFSALI